MTVIYGEPFMRGKNRRRRKKGRKQRNPESKTGGQQLLMKGRKRQTATVKQRNELELSR